MTKLQKQKHIANLITQIKAIPGIEETRFGNFKLSSKNVSFYIKDNNLRIERKEICIFSEPWVHITAENLRQVIDKILSR